MKPGNPKAGVVNQGTITAREELAGIDRGLDDAHRRRFAPDEEVRRGFAKLRHA
jgi:predicted transcriptional regulator